MRAAAVLAALVIAVFVVTSLLGRHVVCDAWGEPMTQLQGDDAEYVEPPPFAVEVSPGCFEVPWWAG